MKRTPKIHAAAIDQLARVFNTHKKGLPEWLKNAREQYLRAGVPPDARHIIINYQRGKRAVDTYLECIDFVGISGSDIEARYLECVPHPVPWTEEPPNAEPDDRPDLRRT